MSTCRKKSQLEGKMVVFTKLPPYQETPSHLQTDKPNAHPSLTTVTQFPNCLALKKLNSSIPVYPGVTCQTISK